MDRQLVGTPPVRGKGGGGFGGGGAGDGCGGLGGRSGGESDFKQDMESAGTTRIGTLDVKAVPDAQVVPSPWMNVQKYGLFGHELILRVTCRK